jgi:hypothetical protein
MIWSASTIDDSQWPLMIVVRRSSAAGRVT